MEDQGAHVFAVIDLLLTVGYIDGRFVDAERTFIAGYLDKLVAQLGQPAADAASWRTRCDEAYAKFEAEIAALAAEVVSADDDHYVATRLKVRAVALFRAFTPADQAVALELLDAVMRADGTVSAPERELFDELRAFFRAEPQLPPATVVPVGELVIEPTQPLQPVAGSHPWLDAIEHRYAADPAVLHAQLASDYALMFQAITGWERQRARGNARLVGVSDVGQLAPGTRLLDGHVHVLRPDRPTELVVLGDLHGCYACLKAALLQSDFIERALRHQRDPANHPDVKLVLLGDYIDRGRFSFEGVLRAALQLQVSLPDHVILLRGNHEFLVRHEGRIVSAVKPAEAVPGIADRVPLDTLEAYRHLFEHMPTSLVFERVLFVHGGIPRDETITARYQDLSSLDDSVVRFEMMWSDPVQTDRVPIELQRESPRFNFGRDQFRSFMDRIGCHTLIRGHEQCDTGFETTLDVGGRKLYTLFSAGGHDNADLPPESRYRNVTPKALTVRATSATAMTAMPWAIQYQPFTTPANNGLYR